MSRVLKATNADDKERVTADNFDFGVRPLPLKVKRLNDSSPEQVISELQGVGITPKVTCHPT